ncbi:hypothetical protein ACFLX3_03855 [Chloroflexota bacterium]
MVQFKGCKRCGGDLSMECDIYGVYAECIQCGANWNRKDLKLPIVSRAGEPAKAKTTEPTAVAGNRR